MTSGTRPGTFPGPDRRLQAVRTRRVPVFHLWRGRRHRESLGGETMEMNRTLETPRIQGRSAGRSLTCRRTQRTGVRDVAVVAPGVEGDSSQTVELGLGHAELSQNLEEERWADLAAPMERNRDGTAVRMDPPFVAPRLPSSRETQS